MNLLRDLGPACLVVLLVLLVLVYVVGKTECEDFAKASQLPTEYVHGTCYVTTASGKISTSYYRIVIEVKP